ncbi:MAG: ATP-binding cassette domain-containing protein [Candidatus Lokiarchaeota archaeon]|nr:ATP-binding cassette domain-containing protein [Candidatus Lokiarchaeota archaeon]
MRSAIKLRNISKIYDLGPIKVEALKDVDLKIRKQEFTAIMGPSGSGKTTLLNMIGALDYPTTGRVFLDGEDITDYDEGEITHIRCRKIGFIFQFFNLVPLLSAKENVMLPMLFAGDLTVDEADERAINLLGAMGMADRADHQPNELSGGQQQRCSIARALANKPAIILADEPTGNTDFKTGTSILSLMKKLNREEGQTFLLVTHDPGIAGIADDVIYVIDGRVQKECPDRVSPPSDTMVDYVKIDKERELKRLKSYKRQLKLMKHDLKVFKSRKNEIDFIKYKNIKNEYNKIIDEIEKKTRWFTQ